MRVKCSPDDTVGDLKKLIAAQTGTDSSKIQLKKWWVIFGSSSNNTVDWFYDDLCAVIARYTIYKDHITLADYEIHDGMSLEMYWCGVHHTCIILHTFAILLSCNLDITRRGPSLHTALVIDGHRAEGLTSLLRGWMNGSAGGLSLFETILKDSKQLI